MMPSRRRKRESGGENASTNVGSNFISDTIDIEDDNHDDNNDDDISNEEEEQVRDCPMKKLSVSKSNVIHRNFEGDRSRGAERLYQRTPRQD